MRKPIRFRARHKYRAKPCELDGIRFASKAEGRYYQRLKLRVAAGEVVFFLRQVPFHLPGGATYRCDFQEFHANGEVHFIDVKGMQTDEFKRSKRQVEALYPVEIETVPAASLR
jgi:hypothetical protein